MNGISLASGETVTFRPIDASDALLLYQIYASTRAEEMAMVVDWSEEEKAVFVQQQFIAQHQYYQNHYPDANFWVILLNDVPIGRLYLHKRLNEYRIVDITLLADNRAKGFGTLILQAILSQAAQDKLPVSIHVERYNKAFYLYQKLGFKISSEENPVYYLMTWEQPDEVFQN